MKDHIEVQHGKLSVKVPRRIFRSDGGIEPVEAGRFRSIMGSRYPWLSERSLDVLMDTAMKEMAKVSENERAGASMGREFLQYDPAKAIRYIQAYLERFDDDAEAWYVLGEALCRVGRVDEGYRALARGRSLR